MGVVGMLVFIPIVSVLYTLLRNNVYGRLDKRGFSVDNSSGELRLRKENTGKEN